jgi:segregation and condensation protein B
LNRVGTTRLPAPDTAARDPRVRRLEAILFLAREPLTSRKLSHYANLADGTEARTLIRRLNAMYDQSGRAFRVEEVAGGYQLLTRPRYAKWLRRLTHVGPPARLSAPALETLAVVAYRQPVLRAEVEAIRGVNCGEILRQLMERDLLRISGRGHDLGRPFLYSTTKRFLQVFGLQNLDKLPRAEVLRGAASAGPHEGGGQPGRSSDERPYEEDTDVSVTSPFDKLRPWHDPAALQAELAPSPHNVDEDTTDGDWEEDDPAAADDDEEKEDEEGDKEYDDDFDEEFEDEEFDDDDDDDFEDDEWEEVDDEDDDDDDDEDWEEEDEEEDEAE